MKTRLLALLGALAPALVACGGGSGGGSSDGSGPSNLTYSAPSARYLVEVAIDPNVPSVHGRVERWSVRPDLPPGLAIDPDTGVIAGTPAAPSEPVEYRVTARGKNGKTRARIVLGVARPPRFAHAVHPSDSTVSIFVVDSFTGALNHNGYQWLGGDLPGLEELVPHPSGLWAFATALAPARVGVYAVNPANGRLALTGTLSTGAGPHDLALSADGTRVYVTAGGEDRIHAFRFDAATGNLLPVGTAQPTGDGPTAVVLDPLGRFAFVVNRLDSSVSVLRVTQSGGLLASLPPRVLVDVPVAAAVDPAGRRVYVAVEGDNKVMPFGIDPQSGALDAEASLPTHAAPADIAIHPTGRFAYVVHESADDLSLLSIDADSGELGALGVVATGTAPVDVVLDASGTYVWIVCQGSYDVDTFRVDVASGALASRGRHRARRAPASLGVILGERPARRRAERVHVLGRDSADVTSFAVDAGGALSALAPPTPTGPSPTDLALDPLGRFAYVASLAAQEVTILHVEPATGALLAAVPPHPMPGRPRAVVVDPSGRFLFVTIEDLMEVRSFAIDALDGTLSPLATATTQAGPNHVAIDPTGRFVYVSNGGNNSITGYEVDQGLFVGASLFAPAPGDPQEVRFSPRGDRAFVALRTAKLLAPYDLDAQTGALQVLPAGSKRTTLQPTAFDVHPSGTLGFAAEAGQPSQTGLLGHFTVDLEDGSIRDVAELVVGLRPFDLVFDPNGRFLFVVNRTGHDLETFALEPGTGSPTLVGSWPAGTTPESVRVTPVVE